MARHLLRKQKFTTPKHFMRKLLFFFVVLTALNACKTIVTKDVVASERFSFLHAGKPMELLVELQEVRTSRRDDRLLFEREVTFDYALVFSAVIDGEHQVLHEVASHKDEDLPSVIKHIHIKRARKRTHVALGYADELVAIFGFFKGNHFVAKAPKLADETQQLPEWRTLNLDREPTPRQTLLRYLSGDERGLFVTGKTLRAILTSVPPKDELNWAFLSRIAGGDLVNLSLKDVEQIVLHNRKSTAWRTSALQMLQANRANFDAPSLIRQTFLLGGTSALKKEDALAVQRFQQFGDIRYIETRIKLDDIPIDAAEKQQMIAAVQRKRERFCTLPDREQHQVGSYVRFLKEQGRKNAVSEFIEDLRRDKCGYKQLHALNSEFLFGTSQWTQQEQNQWAKFAYDHFHRLPASERKWNYDLLEKFLTCGQQRTLLTTYKKDIDVFNDKQVPVCE